MQIYDNLSPEIKQYINNFIKEKNTFNKVLNQLEQFNILKIQHNLNNYNFLKLLQKKSLTFTPTNYFYKHLLVTGQLTNIFLSKRYNCRFNNWGNRCEDCHNLNIKYFLENREYIYPNYRRLHTRFNDVEIFYKWTNKNLPQMYILAILATEPDFSDTSDSETDSESSDSEESEEEYADTNFIPYPHLNDYFTAAYMR